MLVYAMGLNACVGALLTVADFLHSIASACIVIARALNSRAQLVAEAIREERMRG